MADEEKDWYILADAPALGLMLFGPTTNRMATVLVEGTSEELEKAGCSIGRAPVGSLNDFAELLDAAPISVRIQEEMEEPEAVPPSTEADMLRQVAKRLSEDEYLGMGIFFRHPTPNGPANPLGIRGGEYAYDDVVYALNFIAKAIEEHPVK